MRHKIKIALFCGALAAVGVLTLLKQPQTFSFYENRSLSAPPELTAEHLLDGSFAAAASRYVNDQLAFREELLYLGKRGALALGEVVVGDVIVAGDTLLPYYARPRKDYSQEDMQTVIQALRQVSSFCAQEDIEFLYVAVPEQSTAFRDRCPPYLSASAYQDDSMCRDFLAALAQNNIPCLDMAPCLSADWERYYSKIDHHYNFYGAYETYVQIINRLNQEGIAAPVTTDLTIYPLDTPYLGGYARKLMGAFPSQERLYTYALAQPIPFRRWNNGVEGMGVLFDETRTDLYVYYMGGDVAETIIRTERPQLPDVLIIGDSFTNALECILYTSFDEMRSLDFRLYTERSICEYLQDYRPDVVLFVRDDTAFISTGGNGTMGLLQTEPIFRLLNQSFAESVKSILDILFESCHNGANM